MTASFGKIQALLNDFSQVSRSHYVAGTDTNESDILHSLSTALFCWKIYEDIASNLNLEKILKYALIHDLVEVYAGDVNTFADAQTRQAKQAAEARSLAEIAATIERDFPHLVEAIRHYEAHSDEESQFVWTVDKMQALIQGQLDDYRPYYEQGFYADDVRRVHGTHFNHPNIHPPLKKLYREVLDQFLSSYDDSKVNPAGIIKNNAGVRR